MAENFTNARSVLQTTDTTIYTCPADTKAIVIGCQVSNVSATSKNLSLWWTDSSDTNSVTRLGELIAIPTQSVYEPISGKLVLEAGDTIVGTSSVNDDLEATLSVLELS